MQFSPLSRHLIPLPSKYPPQLAQVTGKMLEGRRCRRLHMLTYIKGELCQERGRRIIV
jgi:hypothetical protein